MAKKIHDLFASQPRHGGTGKSESPSISLDEIGMLQGRTVSDGLASDLSRNEASRYLRELASSPERLNAIPLVNRNDITRSK